MTRLLPTLLLDLKLQFRYGFFHVGAFMAVFWLLILRQFSGETLAIILPALLLESFLITTFYFIAGLFLPREDRRRSGSACRDALANRGVPEFQADRPDRSGSCGRLGCGRGILRL